MQQFIYYFLFYRNFQDHQGLRLRTDNLAKQILVKKCCRDDFEFEWGVSCRVIPSNLQDIDFEEDWPIWTDIDSDEDCDYSSDDEYEYQYNSDSD